ncbi:uncharacterized protein LOC143447539 [Clavelina lepadiformis]|uniref:uncharacterized protein LOC143447539 n=1 Tax=Clavelina lepadiformis TaxID=159417 RepID=UPI004042A3D7
MLRYDTSVSSSDRSSDSSIASWFSYSSDLSVFYDDKDQLRKIPPEKLRYSAQQLAESSASRHYPQFCSAVTGKCIKLHWACHVGWCLCKYQYQPLTPLHLLPNTSIPARQHFASDENFEITEENLTFAACPSDDDSRRNVTAAIEHKLTDKQHLYDNNKAIVKNSADQDGGRDLELHALETTV